MALSLRPIDVCHGFGSVCGQENVIRYTDTCDLSLSNALSEPILPKPSESSSNGVSLSVHERENGINTANYAMKDSSGKQINYTPRGSWKLTCTSTGTCP
jgi:hypothetical protein